MISTSKNTLYFFQKMVLKFHHSKFFTLITLLPFFLWIFQSKQFQLTPVRRWDLTKIHTFIQHLMLSIRLMTCTNETSIGFDIKSSFRKIFISVKDPKRIRNCYIGEHFLYRFLFCSTTFGKRMCGRENAERNLRGVGQENTHNWMVFGFPRLFP